FCFASRRRHTRSKRDWSSDVCSSDLKTDRVDKLLRTRVLKAEDVIQYGVTDVRMRWLMSQETPSIDIVFSDVLQQIETLHEPLRSEERRVGKECRAR